MIHAVFVHPERCPKPHGCEEILWPKLVDDLQRRGLWLEGGLELKTSDNAPLNEWLAVYQRACEAGTGVVLQRCDMSSLDLGGSVGRGAPRLRVTLAPGVAVEYWAEQAETVLLTVRGAPKRTFADGTPYRKLHGRHAVVLAEEHHATLVEAVRSRLDEAEDAIDAYYRAHPETAACLGRLRTAGQARIERV